MNILHVTPSFYPATKWGGPIWSTKAICDGIHETTDMNVRVLTTDAASPDLKDRVGPPTLAYPTCFTRRLAGHSIAPGLLARLPAAIRWADVVHVTGTYSFPTLPTLALARLMQRPVVWSPRGALQATAAWDDAPRKRVKHLFERAAQFLRPERTVLHVTAGSEAADSVGRLRGIETTLIPNCVDVPKELPTMISGVSALRLLYVGRLHPKKGLDLLFDAVMRMTDNVVLDVYGTGDDAYVQTLTIQAAQSNGRIRLHGQVSGAAKTQAFVDSDIFVLPSYSENFGIAVAEALAHGTPVITTKGTPWQGLEHNDCGQWIDLNTVDLVDEVTAFARLDLTQMGANGRAWMRRDFAPGAMTSAFVDLYRSLAAPVHQRVLV